MRFFKSKPQPPEATFKEKTAAFWQWWAAESVRLLASVSEDGGLALQPEISAAVNKLHPGLAWVFGPGENEQGQSFTLSPEGNRNTLFLTSYAIARAPDLPGWTFHASRQPSPDIDGMEIRMGDSKVATKSLWITPELNEEEETIDITAWSPTFADIGEEHSMGILYLLLDEALGEQGVESSLGIVEIGRGKLEDSLPITELRDFVDTSAAEKGWTKLPLEEAYTSYHLEQPLGDFPRGDTIAGTTRNMSIVGDYLNAHGKVEDPIAGSGANYMFVQLPRDIFPDNEEVDFRARIEEALEAAFDADQSGMLLGGAMGADAGYIEMVIFDGDRSRDLIRQVLDAQGLQDHYQFESFTK